MGPSRDHRHRPARLFHSHLKRQYNPHHRHPSLAATGINLSRPSSLRPTPVRPRPNGRFRRILRVIEHGKLVVLTSTQNYEGHVTWERFTRGSVSKTNLTKSRARDERRRSLVPSVLTSFS